jgi:5-methylcytosine-specific restriction endonuclease McrA
MPKRVRVCSGPGCPELHSGSGKCPPAVVPMTLAVVTRRRAATRAGVRASADSSSTRNRRVVTAVDPRATSITSRAEARRVHIRDELQSLCPSCHSRKTVAEDGGFGR